MLKDDEITRLPDLPVKVGWVGNSFPASRDWHVQQVINGLAAHNGQVAGNSTWDEGGAAVVP